MKKTISTPAMPNTTAPANNQPQENTAEQPLAQVTYTEPASTVLPILTDTATEPAKETTSDTAPEPATEPATTPEPAEEPAPVQSKADRLADRMLKMQQLNKLNAQLGKLKGTSEALEEFIFKVDVDEERRFASIEIRDDANARWYSQNPTLCTLLTDYLKKLVSEKLEEKEAELLSVQL